MILDKAFAFLKKDALTAWRYKNGFVLNAIAPAAQLGTFYYLSGAIGPQFRPEGMHYFSFLLVGTGFYSFLLTGVYAFLRTVQESQQGGTLEVLMTCGTGPAVMLCLSAVSALGGAFVQFVIYVGAGALLFSHDLHINVSGTILVLTSSLLIAVAIGVFAAGLQIWIHKGSAVLWALGSSSWLIAGTLFPIAALPRPIRIFSELLPFTHSLTGMRLALLQGVSSSALRAEISTLFLFAIVMLPCSLFLFSRTVRQARQLGTLSWY